MTTDERLHYLGGFAMAMPWRFSTLSRRMQRVAEIDLYGWEREVAQHDPDLNEHQVAEAKAWGRGARRALGVVMPWMSPPYPA